MKTWEIQGKKVRAYNQGKDLIIIGNTYPVKDKIKELGGKWQPNEKSWRITKMKQSALPDLTISETFENAPAWKKSRWVAENGNYMEQDYEDY